MMIGNPDSIRTYDGNELSRGEKVYQALFTPIFHPQARVRSYLDTR